MAGILAIVLMLASRAYSFDSAQGAESASAASVIVVYRADFPVHAGIAADIEEKFRQAPSTLRPVSAPLDPHSARSELSELLADIPPRYAVAIGDVALAACLLSGHMFSSAVFVMASDPDLIAMAEERGWCGTDMWVSPETQARIIRSLYPGAKKISTVITTGFSSQGAKFRLAAQRHGFKLDIITISSTGEVQNVVRKAFQSGDIYWMLPDPELMNSVFLELVLLCQQETRTPVFTFTKRLVKMGSASGAYYNMKDMARVIKAAIDRQEPYRGHCEKIFSSTVRACLNTRVVRRLHIAVAHDPGIALPIEKLK